MGGMESSTGKEVRDLPGLDNGTVHQSIQATQVYNWTATKWLLGKVGSQVAELQPVKEAAGKLTSTILASSFGMSLLGGVGVAALTVTALIDLFSRNPSLISQVEAAMRDVLAQHAAAEQLGRIHWGCQLLWESNRCGRAGQIQKCSEAERVLGQSIAVAHAHLSGEWTDHHLSLYLVMQTAIYTRLLALQQHAELAGDQGMTEQGIKDTMKAYFRQLEGLVPKYHAYRMSKVEVVMLTSDGYPAEGAQFIRFLRDGLTGKVFELPCGPSKSVGERCRSEYKDFLQRKYKTSLDVHWMG